jgi:hypothetical protein
MESAPLNKKKIPDGISYKTCTFTFDSINLAAGLNVVLQGENSLILKTRNNGNFSVGTNLNANGGNAQDSYVGYYSAIDHGIGKLGGLNGGIKALTNGSGSGGGKLEGGGVSGNLVGGGGGYGSAGEYNSNDFDYGKTYGTPTLSHLLGGSGGGAGISIRGWCRRWCNLT